MTCSALTLIFYQRSAPAPPQPWGKNADERKFSIVGDQGPPAVDDPAITDQPWDAPTGASSQDLGTDAWVSSSDMMRWGSDASADKENVTNYGIAFVQGMEGRNNLTPLYTTNTSRYMLHLAFAMRHPGLFHDTVHRTTPTTPLLPPPRPLPAGAIF